MVDQSADSILKERNQKISQNGENMKVTSRLKYEIVIMGETKRHKTL